MNIETLTLKNKNYRKVIKTEGNMQVVVMSLNPGEYIPLERHPKTTQFIKVESGTGYSVVESIKTKLEPGSMLIVPPDTRHFISHIEKLGTDAPPLKLYTIYSPPEHAKGLIQKKM